MKFGPVLFGISLGGRLGFGLTNYVTLPKAQPDRAKTTSIAGAPSAAQWPWADSLDAQAAPENHRVVYEDSTVRIRQTLVAGHTAEPIHTHKWKSIRWITKPVVPCSIYQHGLAKTGKFVATDSVTVPHRDLNVGQASEAKGPTGIKIWVRTTALPTGLSRKKAFN